MEFKEYYWLTFGLAYGTYFHSWKWAAFTPAAAVVWHSVIPRLAKTRYVQDILAEIRRSR